MAHRKPHYYITFSLVVTTPLVTSHGVCDGFIMEKKLDSVIKFCDNKEEKKNELPVCSIDQEVKILLAH